MQYNYINSVAESSVKFTSSVEVTETDSSVENFNAFSIYIGSDIASDNIVDWDTTLTSTTYAVKTVTADNYTDVMQGDLLSQWKCIFNDGANLDPILYIVVYYVPDGTGEDSFSDYLTVGTSTITYSPLTVAFNAVYYISYFKFLFSEYYTGDNTDDTNYCDTALALAQLCANETTLSACWLHLHIVLPLATTDTNPCLIMSTTAAEEEAAMTALNVTITDVDYPRTAYFWGALKLLELSRVYLTVHSEDDYMPAICIANVFNEGVNAAGIYVGNELDFVRLSGDDVMPTGTPNVLNSEANDNLSTTLSGILDDKNVGYWKSIADGTVNNAVLNNLVSIYNAVPVLAPMVGKYIDYHCSQDIAKWLTAAKNTNAPVFHSEDAYEYVKSVLLGYLNLFGTIGELTSISLSGFPSYASIANVSKTSFTVSAGWTATWVYKLKSMTISGTISA